MNIPFNLEEALQGAAVEHHFKDTNGRLWITELEPVELLPKWLDGKDYLYACEANYYYDKPEEFWIPIDQTQCLFMKQ